MPMAYLRYQKEFPNLVRQMKNRHIRYNETLKYLYEQEKEGKVFILCPKEPVEIGRVEKDKENWRNYINRAMIQPESSTRN